MPKVNVKGRFLTFFVVKIFKESPLVRYLSSTYSPTSMVIAYPKRSHRSHSRKPIYARHHVHGCRLGEMARRPARPLSRQLQHSGIPGWSRRGLCVADCSELKPRLLH